MLTPSHLDKVLFVAVQVQSWSWMWTRGLVPEEAVDSQQGEPAVLLQLRWLRGKSFQNTVKLFSCLGEAGTVNQDLFWL